jgi:hypothetical protein
MENSIVTRVLVYVSPADALQSWLSSAISSSSKKLEDHDICAPIFGMGREVALSRRIPVLVITSVAGPWRGER